MTPRACSRAHFSAASTSSTQVGAPRSGASSRVRATRSTMPRNDRRPATKAATASSLAALNSAGTTPPASPATRASRTAGKATSSSGLELPGARRRPVQGRLHDREPVGPGQRQRDRQPHVGRAGLGDRRAVGEGDHRVHDRLRVHDDVDVGVGDVEEQVGLDELEALVHQRRGVDRDHRAHVPGRVREGVVHGHVGEVVAARPRNGPPLAVSTSRATSLARAAAQALRERRVLGVDRDELPGCGRGADEVTAGDQRLLVGQRDGAAGLQRRQGRAAARSSR